MTAPKDGFDLLKIDGGVDHPIIVAAAVVRQAFRDLTCHPKNKGPSEILTAETIRKDAADFLMHRLWEEDCLWGSLLEQILIKSHVVSEVRKRLAAT